MNIELTPKQERILHDALQQGRFQSVDAAVTKPRLTPVEAAAHIRELRKGNILPEGTTIRAMIEEGRA